jgi:hypothetical protein
MNMNKKNVNFSFLKLQICTSTYKNKQIPGQTAKGGTNSLNLMSDIRSKTNPYVHTLQAPYTIVGSIGRFSLLFLGSFRMPISPWKVLQSSSHKRLSSDHLGWVLILRETSPATILGGVSPGSAKCSADHCA